LTGDAELVTAIREGRADDVLLLLDRGASPDARVRPYSALHHAVIAGREVVARMLLDAGAEVDVRSDDHQRTPLHYARSEACARLLLARGADPNARHHAGRTPLGPPAEDDRADLVRLLVASGSDPDARDLLGWTPVHVAASAHADQALAALLSLGANPAAADEVGGTPLHAAVHAARDRGAESAEPAIGSLLAHGAHRSAATTGPFGADEIPGRRRPTSSRSSGSPAGTRPACGARSPGRGEARSQAFRAVGSVGSGSTGIASDSFRSFSIGPIITRRSRAPSA
jgi:ankyrin repeat protein